MITNNTYFHILIKKQVLGELLDHAPLHLDAVEVAEPYHMSDGNRGNNMNDGNRGNNKHKHSSIYAVDGPVVLATAFKFGIVNLSSPRSIAAGDAFYLFLL